MLCLIGKLTLPELDTYQHVLSLVCKITRKMLYWRYGHRHAVSASATTPTILLYYTSTVVLVVAVVERRTRD